MIRQGKIPRFISPPVLLLVGSILALGACDDDPTEPVEGEASTEAMVVDEPAPNSTYSGDMTGNFQFSVSNDGQTWIDVGSPNGITLLLQNDARVSVHGSQEAPGGTFTHVRLLIRTAEVTIAAGSEIDGTVLTADATVNVAQSEDVIIESQISPPQVEANEVIVVTFDLNSEAWLTAAALAAGEASNAAVASAVQVTTEVRAQ